MTDECIGVSFTGRPIEYIVAAAVPFRPLPLLHPAFNKLDRRCFS
jgi:hypothetical protein